MNKLQFKLLYEDIIFIWCYVVMLCIVQKVYRLNMLHLMPVGFDNKLL